MAGRRPLVSGIYHSKDFFRGWIRRALSSGQALKRSVLMSSMWSRRSALGGIVGAIAGAPALSSGLPLASGQPREPAPTRRKSFVSATTPPKRWVPLGVEPLPTFYDDFDDFQLRTCPGRRNSLDGVAQDGGAPDIGYIWKGQQASETKAGYKNGVGRYPPRSRWPEGAKGQPGTLGEAPAPFMVDPEHPDWKGYSPFKIIRPSVLGITLERTPRHLESTVPIEPATGRPYRWLSGHFTTRWTHAQRYGFIQAGLKLPAHLGLSPFFLLMPDAPKADGSWWPPSIGIVESIGEAQTFSSSLHFVDGEGRRQHISRRHEGTRLDDRFHDFGLLWTASACTIFLDGKAIGEMPTQADTNGPAMHIVLGLSCGGEVAPVPSDDLNSATLEIDYLSCHELAQA
jgi:hypothetical protein